VKQVKGVRGFGVTAMLALAVTAGVAGGALALTANGGAQVVEQQQDTVRFAPAAEGTDLVHLAPKPADSPAPAEADAAAPAPAAEQVAPAPAPEPVAQQPVASAPKRKVAASETADEPAPATVAPAEEEPAVPTNDQPAPPAPPKPDQGAPDPFEGKKLGGWEDQGKPFQKVAEQTPQG
jgi:hypothetical protein